VSFSEKLINVTFKLGTGSFGESGIDTATVSNLRVRASIHQAGGASMGQCHLTVYGLPPSMLNQLTALRKQIMMLRKDFVSVEAGDSNGTSLIFQGQITEGWTNLNSIPNSVLQMAAYSGAFEAVKPVTATSYPGAANVDDIMKTIAGKMGLAYQNNGVSVSLSRPYFSGTGREQAQACAEHADINWLIENGTLFIWPKGSAKGTIKTPVSADTGMVGYPAFDGVGVSITTLFNPQITYGSYVDVDSVIKQANGEWYVYSVSHDLESQTPGGQWFTHFHAAPQYQTHVLPK